MRQCTICRHPGVSQINGYLKDGKRSIRSLADEFSISKSSLERHKQDHLSLSLIAGTEAGIAIHESMGELNTRTLALLKKAESAADLRGALLAIKEIRANFDLMGRLSGELSQAGLTLNSGISVDEFSRFQSIIIQETCTPCRERILTRMEGLRVIPIIPVDKTQQNGTGEAGGLLCSS